VLGNLSVPSLNAALQLVLDDLRHNMSPPCAGLLGRHRHVCDTETVYMR
jgi:hypothetical protein